MTTEKQLPIPIVRRHWLRLVHEVCRQQLRVIVIARRQPVCALISRSDLELLDRDGRREEVDVIVAATKEVIDYELDLFVCFPRYDTWVEICEEGEIIAALMSLNDYRDLRVLYQS